MTPRGLKNLKLLAAFCASSLVGAAVGYAHDRHQAATVTSINEMLTAHPQSQAAYLTFRFGKAEQARALLMASPISEGDPLFHWGDLMMRDLRMVVICRELHDSQCEEAFLASATLACSRRGLRKCTADEARRAVAHVQKGRVP